MSPSLNELSIYFHFYFIPQLWDGEIVEMHPKDQNLPLSNCQNHACWYPGDTWACFPSLARKKLRLCSANHRPGYWSNLPCDWPSTAWAYSEQETENGPWSQGISMHRIDLICMEYCLAHTWRVNLLLKISVYNTDLLLKISVCVWH